MKGLTDMINFRLTRMIRQRIYLLTLIAKYFVFLTTFPAILFFVNAIYNGGFKIQVISVYITLCFSIYFCFKSVLFCNVTKFFLDNVSIDNKEPLDGNMSDHMTHSTYM